MKIGFVCGPLDSSTIIEVSKDHLTIELTFWIKVLKLDLEIIQIDLDIFEPPERYEVSKKDFQFQKPGQLLSH